MFSLLLIVIVISVLIQIGFTMRFMKYNIFGRDMTIIRDDLISLGVNSLSGNKARKLKFLVNNNDNKMNNNNIKLLASYGGYQSNSMLAIAKIANEYNYDFVYYTKRIPNFIKTSSKIGNYKLAIDLGMNVLLLLLLFYNNFWP